MGIEEVTRYTVRCDGCGRRLIDNFGRFAESHTSDDAEEAAGYQGWFVGPTRILCEDCARVVEAKAKGDTDVDSRNQAV